MSEHTPETLEQAVAYYLGKRPGTLRCATVYQWAYAAARKGWKASERRAEELGRRLEAIARLAACEGHTPLYSEACDRLLEIGALALPPEESR